MEERSRMIGHFPAALIVPGLLFLAGGLYYHSRAAALDPAGDLTPKLTAANRRTGNISIAFGVLQIALAIPLGLALQQFLY
jgi:hypothetical protein